MWRMVLISMAISVAMLVPSSVNADTSAEVTVTAVGYICEAPGGFTLTYVNDHEVGISWTKGEGAANTLIRAKYGSYPEDADDGYLVYYGDGESCSDTAVSLDETATAVHYRAWSEDEHGAVTAEWAEGTMEGIGMTLIGFVILALGLTVMAFLFKRIPLFFLSGLGWAGFAGWEFTQMSDSSDIHHLFAWLGVGAALLCFLAPAWFREKGEEPEPPLPPDEQYRQDLREMVGKARAGVRRRRGTRL